MRVRLARGRLVVVGSDGRHVAYGLGMLAAFAAAVAVAVAGLWWYADRSDDRSLAHDVGASIENLVFAAPAPHESALPTLELAVPENTFTDLERALRTGDKALGHEDGGDRAFANAQLLDGGALLPCEVAFLAPPLHHDALKPSLRIKLARTEARDLDRRIDLFRPEDPLALDAFLYSTLAQRMGLVSDRLAHVRLFVNKKPFGVYYRALTPGPSMAFAAARMPGTFVFAAPGRDAWGDASAWQRPATSDAGEAPVAELLEALARDPSRAADEALARLVDGDAFARFAALRALLGRAFAAGQQLALFWAPAHGRFEPVAWSFDGARGAADQPIEPAGDRLLARLARDPAWRRARDGALARVLATAAPAVLDALLAATDAKLAPDLAADLRLVAPDAPGGPLHTVPVTELAARRTALRAYLEVRRALCARHATAAASAAGEGAPADVVLGPGDVRVDADLTTEVGQHLVLRAGTRLLLGGGIGVHARGPVHVEGTAAEPVLVRRASHAPFASFAITGPAAAGSRIAHLDIEGGAPQPAGHRRFSAMLVVYDCADVAFDACRFGPAGDGADSVALWRSDAVLRGCRFVDARADALDVAFGTVRLSDGVIHGAEKNGVDLMAARADLERCTIDGALRAGVSAGENARVRVAQCTITRGDLGLECRDGARALVATTAFTQNRVGVSCWFDTWRFARGGAALLAECSFAEQTEEDVVVEPRSRVLWCGAAEPRVRASVDKRFARIDTVPDGWLDLPEER